MAMLSATAKQTAQRPSEIAGLRPWLARATPFGDWWYCYQFDNAVSQFGIWLENKLNELDDNGKPVNTLHDLIADAPSQPPRAVRNVDEFLTGARPMEEVIAFFGMGPMRKQ